MSLLEYEYYLAPFALKATLEGGPPSSRDIAHETMG